MRLRRSHDRRCGGRSGQQSGLQVASSPSEGAAAASDSGLTVVETIISVLLSGTLVASAAAGVATIWSTDSSVSRVAAIANDTRQLTRWFPYDIQGASRLASDYKTSPGTLLGCGSTEPNDAGNILRFDRTEPSGERRRIAYRLAEAAVGEAPARIDRHACVDSGGGFGAAFVVNVADAVNAPNPSSVVVAVNEADGEVATVSMSWTTTSGDTTTAEAATTVSVDAAAEAAAALPACPENPIAEVSGFLAFTSGDLTLENLANVNGAIAAGDDIEFNNGASVSFAFDNTTFTALSGTYGTDVAVYAHDDIGLGARGQLTIDNGGYLVAGQFARWGYGTAISTQTLLESDDGLATVFSASSRQRVGDRPVALDAAVIDFETAFDAITVDSAGLAGLPGTCAQANHLTISDGVGTYSGTGPMSIEYTSDNVNVLNVTTAELAGVTTVSHVGTERPGMGDTSLLINVTDSGTVNWTPPTFTVNYPNHVMWHFPNATRVNVTGANLWGTVIAPQADVTVSGVGVKGNVVAASYTLSGDNMYWQYRYLASFPWEAWAPS